ncbi:hypothetical protein JCM1840_000456 [Sporobolomyces johnsonii]
MGDSDSLADPRGPVVVFSRNELLALYASPLVPKKLDGMKDLAEWYGEYLEPPSPPSQRHHLPSRPPQSSSTPSRRPFNNPDNPFANFGRFGVDGGLGEALELTSNTRRNTHHKDLAPHLGGGRRGKGENGEALEGSSPTKERGGFFSNERERSERMRATRNGEGRETIGDREKRRDGELGRNGGEKDRKDRRGLGPADEGGWRSVGTTREEREKRLIRNHSSNTTSDSRRDRPHDRDRGDRDAYSNSRSNRGPAWMDDDNNASSSSPAWMDAPATGSLSFGTSGTVVSSGGAALETDELEPPPAKVKSGAGADGMTFGATGGMDSIQQWKMQMKELERKERERDLRAAGIEPDSTPTKEDVSTEPAESKSSVFSGLAGSTAHESVAPAAPAKSIFEDLGVVRPPGLPASNGDSSRGAARGEGGRSSRFAKFFDGKPPTMQAPSPTVQAQQPPPSVFGALLGGAAGGGAASAGSGPSKEDNDSMARLLGMLQVSGSRTASPTIAKSPPVPSPSLSPAVVSAHPPAPSASSSNSGSTAHDEGRSSSRFKFSSTKAPVQPQPPQQPFSPSLQSLQSPTPLPSNIPMPPGFAGFPPQHQQGPLSLEGIRSPPLAHQQQQHARTPTGDNGAPQPNHHAAHPTSPPLPSQSRGPYPPQNLPPQFFTGPNGQRLPPPPPGMTLLPMFPPGGPPPMLSPEMLRNLPPGVNPNQLAPMRSPPAASGPAGGPPFPPHMMFPPPPPGFVPPHLQGTRGGGMPPMGPPPHAGAPPPPPGMSLGGNAGADLMALLNSGSGGARIGGPPPPGQGQPQGGRPDVPPFLMEGR